MLNSTRGDIVGDCPRCGEHSIVDPQVLNALSQTTRGPDDVSVYVNVCVFMYFLCIFVYAYVFVVFVYVFLCICMYIL